MPAVPSAMASAVPTTSSTPPHLCVSMPRRFDFPCICVSIQALTSVDVNAPTSSPLPFSSSCTILLARGCGLSPPSRHLCIFLLDLTSLAPQTITASVICPHQSKTPSNLPALSAAIHMFLGLLQAAVQPLRSQGYQTRCRYAWKTTSSDRAAPQASPFPSWHMGALTGCFHSV